MFPHFDTIPECDRQTDGFTVAYTVLAKLALRSTVLISEVDTAQV